MQCRSIGLGGYPMVAKNGQTPSRGLSKGAGNSLRPHGVGRSSIASRRRSPRMFYRSEDRSTIDKEKNDSIELKWIKFLTIWRGLHV
jgi:hypothetical protein